MLVPKRRSQNQQSPKHKLNKIEINLSKLVQIYIKKLFKIPLLPYTEVIILKLSVYPEYKTFPYFLLNWKRIECILHSSRMSAFLFINKFILFIYDMFSSLKRKRFLFDYKKKKKVLKNNLCSSSFRKKNTTRFVRLVKSGRH